MSPIAIRATARSASCRYGLGAARSVSAHRRAAGVPEQIGFPTKPELALAQVDQLLTDDLPRAPLAADAGHGSATGFREAPARVSSAIGIMRETAVWPKGQDLCRQRTAVVVDNPPSAWARPRWPISCGPRASPRQVVRWLEGTGYNAVASRSDSPYARPIATHLRVKLRERIQRISTVC